MATIGLRDVYYALLLTDPEGGGKPTYDTPVRIVGAISANINPNPSSSTLFGDDGPMETASTLGEISLELNVADIPLETQAALLGHTYDKGMLKAKSTDVAPYVAVAFRTLKSNGKYRYYWLNKGKFSVPEEDYQTKGDSVEFQTPTITGAFAKRVSDDEWKRVIDEDDATADQDVITNWFTSPVYEKTTPGA